MRNTRFDVRGTLDELDESQGRRAGWRIQEHTPSGLPAISPTRGEKRRGSAFAHRETEEESPSPLWGGVGEGIFVRCRGGGSS